MIETLQTLSLNREDSYTNFKALFLYHSNAIEGSTFTFAQLVTYFTEEIVQGEHKYDDVITSMNSSLLFDDVISTLNDELDIRFIKQMHSRLMQNTRLNEMGMSGVFKQLPNKIGLTDLELAKPHEVEPLLDDLLNMEVKSVHDIAKFHARFEKIHPFADGNGRIGRMIILKQCLENEITPIIINDLNIKEYRENLYKAQTEFDYEALAKFFKKEQEVLLDNEHYKFILEIDEYSKNIEIE